MVGVDLFSAIIISPILMDKMSYFGFAPDLPITPVTVISFI
jgi:hypothetical protein